MSTSVRPIITYWFMAPYCAAKAAAFVAALNAGAGWGAAVPQAAIDLAKRFEGFHRVPQSDPLRRAQPYVCPAGYLTIGWGHLCPPDHPPVTEADAESYLTVDLSIALAATHRYCPVLLNQSENRLAADVDFTFNLGAGLGGAAAGGNCAVGQPTMHSFIPSAIRHYRNPRRPSSALPMRWNLP